MKIIPGTRRTHEIIYLRCYLFPTSYKLLHIIILNWYNVNTFTIQSVLIAHAFLIGSVLLIVLVFYIVFLCFVSYVVLLRFTTSYSPFGMFILFLSMSGLSLRYLHSFLGYVWFVPLVSLTTFLIYRKCCYAVTDIRSNLCV